MPRISVFVDAANLFYVQHRLGWHVNPQRLLDHVVGPDTLADAFWYTGVRAHPPDVDQEKFLRWLSHVGYTVRRKTIKSFVNVERGSTVEKANLDVEIVADMLTTIDTYDLAALVSGDGDFEHVVELLRARGKRVRVYSIDPVIAFELRNAVGSHYVDFWSIRSEVERIEEVPAPSTLVTPAAAAAGLTVGLSQSVVSPTTTTHIPAPPPALAPTTPPPAAPAEGPARE
ncbi:MAG: NYN domain-containing protein [Planctomycetes bacterium]|nr:NYN domain-containing protein [Planctomycetota bacterium]